MIESAATAKSDSTTGALTAFAADPALTAMCTAVA
jgi:hypothetical protein